MKNTNWYMVACDAFTAIRINFQVEVLQRLASEGNETPASGDSLARRKADMK